MIGQKKYLWYNIAKLFFAIVIAFSTHAKSELILPQNAVVFSVEQTQSFRSSEKEVQPNSLARSHMSDSGNGMK